MITLDDLRAICPTTAKAQLEKFVEPLNAGMKEYAIDNNVAREAQFLAQVAHESGGFNFVREIASGSAYEGRKDLGNLEPGDGVRFKGRGLIQITGRANYADCGNALGQDFVTHPELLETPENAARSACWFWANKGLNALADDNETLKITKRINGGTNGLQSRLAYLAKAEQVLG